MTSAAGDAQQLVDLVFRAANVSTNSSAAEKHWRLRAVENAAEYGFGCVLVSSKMFAVRCAIRRD